MKAFDYTVFVAASPTQVFRVIADPRSKLAWVPAIRRVELKSDGALGVGTRYLASSGIGPFEFVFDEQIVEWVDSERVAYEGCSPWGAFRATAVLEEVKDGTQLHHRMDYSFPAGLFGTFLSMAGYLVGLLVLRSLETRVAVQLKEVVERGGTSWWDLED